ncbi:hypothetical protein ACOYR1_17745 [Thalassotalea piscium]
MKNLKPLIFSAHAELKSKLPAIKKSHLYEAFASFCGFKSYAAFQAATVNKIDDIELANRQCFERMQHIGFDASSALLICQQTQNLWEQRNNISLAEIYAFYCTPAFEDYIDAPHMFSALKTLAVSGDKDAILVGLVLCSQILAEYKENPDNRSGEYWYKKLIANQALSSFQQEVAEEYQQVQPYKVFLDTLVSELIESDKISLPSPLVIRTLCRQFDDRRERHWTHYFKNDYFHVQQAFAFINHYKGDGVDIIPETLILDWQKAEVMVTPYRGDISETIEHSITNQEKWFWYYWGLAHDIDVTQDDLYAINADTGEDYDDCGPMAVSGYEGIALPDISAAEKANAQKLAQQLAAK